MKSRIVLSEAKDNLRGQPANLRGEIIDPTGCPQSLTRAEHWEISKRTTKDGDNNVSCIGVVQPRGFCGAARRRKGVKGEFRRARVG